MKRNNVPSSRLVRILPDLLMVVTVWCAIILMIYSHTPRLNYIQVAVLNWMLVPLVNALYMPLRISSAMVQLSEIAQREQIAVTPFSAQNYLAGFFRPQFAISLLPTWTVIPLVALAIFSNPNGLNMNFFYFGLCVLFTISCVFMAFAATLVIFGDLCRGNPNLLLSLLKAYLFAVIYGGLIFLLSSFLLVFIFGSLIFGIQGPQGSGALEGFDPAMLFVFWGLVIAVPLVHALGCRTAGRQFWNVITRRYFCFER